MKICVINSSNKTQKFQIQITSPHDPLILYTLDMSEVEYHQLKNEQCLLIDFQNFTPFLINMLDTCLKDENFICILHKKNVTEALFVIQERTKFKEINHLILNVAQANDTAVKKFLGALSNEFKMKFENACNSLDKLNTNFEILEKENSDLKEQIQKELNDKQNALDTLLNEKNKEINEIKEKCFQETKNQVDTLEKTKNQKISKLEKKMAQLQDSYNKLSEEQKALDDYKMKLEMNHKDLESKHAISNTELNVYKEDILHLRQDNSNLNQKCFQQEKDLTELRLKNENLLKQNEEKEKGILSLNQLVETLTKQRESYEDTIKSLKASNNKLEDKLQQGINEINKGNDIIQKLQNEIKNLKSKNKTLKQALSTQEQLTEQKQNLLDEQIRNVNDLKRESETKEREIASLKNQVTSYSMKLTDNEKIIEDNKQMLMYLNKKVNDTMSNPFKSRVNGFSSDPMQNSQTSYTKTNNFGNNNFSSTYGNFNPDTNYQVQNPKYTTTNVNEYMTDQFGNSEMNMVQNQMQTSGNNTNSNNSSGLLIMPETNFCNYKPSAKMANTLDKYCANTANSSLNGNLLNHKYGIVNSPLTGGNNMGDLSSGSMGFKGDEGMRNTNTNFEEEFPRQMTQPQQMLVSK